MSERLMPQGIKDKKQPNTTDSSLVCHIGLSGVRKHTSIRCDEAIWEAFKQLCSANGLSTCDLLEKVLIGVCVGLQTRVAQTTTINVLVDAPRIVKRVRRRQVVFEDEVEEVDGELCHFCLKDKRRSIAKVKLRYRPDGRTFYICGLHTSELLRSSDWEAAK